MADQATLDEKHGVLRDRSHDVGKSLDALADREQFDRGAGLCRLLDASVEPVDCAPATAARPLAWWLAASDAAAGLGWTATLRHTSFQITPPARLLLPLLDGTRDRSALLQCLVDIAVSGTAQLTEHGAVVTDLDRITALCLATLDRELATYARSGLFVEAGPAA